ncbi:PTS fructose transporter subunit IIB [Haloarchaeobius sp. HME9146]|uniref:PTS fructose transporter subunit IIB n=1 Tax=Haloarchaeobius sp. HME9146 TaxID=2978732 RepID=UPI0021BF425B|nr:PTS fructose transporter subunit IIB [Haloarchaeobius sp. HME9146]MCT9097065.1 fructose PTS transporter subunit IIB [Haloarchaeobius sp. HME9146]
MKLVAVTSCPTGIAHSQMAAENLEQTAPELGHEIKVEVQGAMGAENELTAAEIDAADAVIIAADTAVSRDRFEGKPLVKGTVKDAVNDPEGLIEQAQAEVDGAGSAEAAGDEAAESETATTDTTDATTTDTEPTQRPKGGDRSKGLFARLKRLFS